MKIVLRRKPSNVVRACVCMLVRCRYLIEHGAQVGAVNSEGELPLDVATEEAMERLLKAEIKKQGERIGADKKQ